jgi:hypothetical protein
MYAQPRVERLVGSGGDRDLAFDVALAANEEVVMSAVGARPADRAHRERAQLGVAQPAVAQQPQQRVVALADDRAAIWCANQVAVLDRGEGLRWADAMRRYAHVGGLVVAAELGQQRAQHRDVRAPCRRRGGPSATPAVALKRAAVGGDRVGRHVGDNGRATELVAQRIAEARVDRAVLARA